MLNRIEEPRKFGFPFGFEVSQAFILPLNQLQSGLKLRPGDVGLSLLDGSSNGKGMIEVNVRPDLIALARENNDDSIGDWATTAFPGVVWLGDEGWSIPGQVVETERLPTVAAVRDHLKTSIIIKSFCRAIGIPPDPLIVQGFLPWWSLKVREPRLGRPSPAPIKLQHL